MTDTGQVINDRYILEGVIGSGGMGVVYRAYDRLYRQVVALKQLHIPVERRYSDTIDLADDPLTNFDVALAHEFRAMASLRHTHIISVLDYGFSNESQPYFTMELLDETQSFVQAASGATLKQKLNMIGQILLALAYLHRRGVIHRDMKPDNVLVTGEYEVRVVDFGLALLAESQHRDRLIGSLLYLAPEVIDGNGASHLSDLYAVGMMAYEIIGGSYPYGRSSSWDALLGEITEQKLDFDALVTQYDPVVGIRLSTFIHGLLNKNPQRRYQSAGDAILALNEILDEPLVKESDAIRESFLQAAAFVGREWELDRLRRALDDAMEGLGSTWLIAGESGVGKTRLMDELRVRALVRGAVTVRGQAAESSGRPFQLWEDVVERLALFVPITDDEASVLRQVVPNLSQLVEREVVTAPELSSEDNQRRLTQTITRLFERVEVPVVVLLEDLQWAKESLSVLRVLHRRVNTCPVLIVGNYRSGEAADLPEQLPAAEVMPLDRLSDSEIKALATQMMGKAGRQTEVLDLLKRETEGNAFFLVEVVRALAAEAGTLDAIGTGELPMHVFSDGIQNIVRRRLDKIPDHMMPLLRTAALLDKQIDMDVMVHLAGMEDIIDWLYVSESATVLEVDEDRWRFSHDRLREAIINAIPAEERYQLQVRAAEAIERAHGTETSFAPMLANHWLAADNIDKAMHYTLLGGQYLVDSGQSERALQLADRALAVVDDNSDRGRLLLLKGSAYHELSNYPACVDVLVPAIAAAESVGDNATLARALKDLGRVLRVQGNTEQAQHYLERGLAIAQRVGDRVTESVCLYSLALVTLTVKDFARARRYAERSLYIARDIADDRGLHSALTVLSLVEQMQGNYAAARSRILEAYQVARRSESAFGVTVALANAGVYSYLLGEPDTAVKYLERAVERGRTLAQNWGLTHAMAHLVRAYAVAHQTDAARGPLLEGIEMAHQMGSPSMVLEFIFSAVYVAFYDDDASQALKWVSVVLADSRTAPETRQQAENFAERLRDHMDKRLVEKRLNLSRDADLDRAVLELMAAFGR